MSTIAQIEDQIIATIADLGLFSLVDSLGRSELPVAMKYPAAFVYFAGDTSNTATPRPIVSLVYDIVITVKNLKSELAAARDTYALLDAVRDAVNGKQLGITDIEPFINTSREIAGYEDGTISYILRFETRRYLPVVT